MLNVPWLDSVEAGVAASVAGNLSASKGAQSMMASDGHRARTESTDGRRSASLLPAQQATLDVIRVPRDHRPVFPSGHAKTIHPDRIVPAAAPSSPAGMPRHCETNSKRVSAI